MIWFGWGLAAIGAAFLEWIAWAQSRTRPKWDWQWEVPMTAKERAWLANWLAQQDNPDPRAVPK